MIYYRCFPWEGFSPHHAIPQKGKDLIAKWDFGTEFKFLFILPKKIVFTLYIVHVQNNRSGGNKEGKFQTYVHLVFQATPWFDRKSLRLVSPCKQANWATPNLNGSIPLTTVTCTPNDHEVPSTALQWRRTNFNGIWVWGIFRSSSSLMTVQQNLTEDKQTALRWENNSIYLKTYYFDDNYVLAIRRCRI